MAAELPLLLLLTIITAATLPATTPAAADASADDSAASTTTITPASACPAAFTASRRQPMLLPVTSIHVVVYAALADACSLTHPPAQLLLLHCSRSHCSCSDRSCFTAPIPIAPVRNLSRWCLSSAIILEAVAGVLDLLEMLGMVHRMLLFVEGVRCPRVARDDALCARDDASCDGDDALRDEDDALCAGDDALCAGDDALCAGASGGDALRAIGYDCQFSSYPYV